MALCPSCVHVILESTVVLKRIQRQWYGVLSTRTKLCREAAGPDAHKTKIEN